MSDLVLSTPATSVTLAQMRESELETHVPFSQPIVIVERARIAGTSYHPDIDDLCELLKVGDKLEMRRDAANREDPWAIRILAPNGKRLGYIPSDINEVLSHLLDAGKHLYCVVTSIEMVFSWHKVLVEVYLDD